MFDLGNNANFARLIIQIQPKHVVAPSQNVNALFGELIIRAQVLVDKLIATYECDDDNEGDEN